MKEIWKSVVGFEGLYEVSDQGRLKSLCLGERILRGSVSAKGYLRANLSKDGKTYRRFIHALVAEAFIGERNGNTINHISGDKKDNRAVNIEYVTARENTNHSNRKNGALPTGVFRNKNKYSASITVKKQRVYLGVFDTPEQAHAAYTAHAKKIGETRYVHTVKQ